LGDTVAPIQSFSEYILSLPEHEAVLLQRFEIFSGFVFDLCSCLQEISQIIVVSDGGGVQQYGSFGWVIGHKDGRRLAQGSGSAFGFNPCSYQAEGYGAKASHLFLLHCFLYCERLIPSGQFTFYCDNQGLLKKLTYL
jgi:hypothetical protein